jgi:hypothetical protein
LPAYANRDDERRDRPAKDGEDELYSFHSCDCGEVEGGEERRERDAACVSEEEEDAWGDKEGQDCEEGLTDGLYRREKGTEIGGADRQRAMSLGGDGGEKVAGEGADAD